MKKLCFYVPAENLNSVKAAIFAVGAGRTAQYAECCWQVLGQGQFRPLTGSSPHIGEAGTLETVPEYRVEMLCRDELADAAIAALYDAHPYEEPAWDMTSVTVADSWENP